MNVLSLFNGMSVANMALKYLDIKVNKYYSSEIDKYANQATKSLYPDIIQLGDITLWQDWGALPYFDFEDIDLLIAGFPCQSWSISGKQKGDNDPRGALVHDLINIWAVINKSRKVANKQPVKFLFENVKMKKSFLAYINKLFGVDPILINSALVSAQNRKRCYWTNIPGVEQPEDLGILLEDVLEDSFTYKRAIRKKSKCVRAGGRGSFDRHEWDSIDDSHSRKLTPRECFRLQTIPEPKIDTLLKSGISNTQLYKMCGNSFTMSVIANIFKGLKERG